MCFYCHTKGHAPGAPAHRSERCTNPNNSHGRRYKPTAATAEEAAAEAAPPAPPPALAKPACKHGAKCYRTSTEHLAAFSHPSKVPAPSSAAEAECSLCKKVGHTSVGHTCPVCSGKGHRGRDCRAVETQGLPGREVTLYHKTSEASGKKIADSKQMLPGSKGMFGAGIYFCSKASDCDGKAHFTGVLIKATVKIGRSLVCRAARPALTMATARENDCTSAFAPGGAAVTRDEYVVFEPWQVRRIEVHADASVPKSAWPVWAARIASSQWQQAFVPMSIPAQFVPPPAAHVSRGVPIAKSTGLPDRRYTQGGRHAKGSASKPNAGGAVPIAKSTGQPDRRFTAAHRGGGGGFGGGGFGGGGGGGPTKADGSPDMRFSANW